MAIAQNRKYKLEKKYLTLQYLISKRCTLLVGLAFWMLADLVDKVV